MPQIEPNISLMRSFVSVACAHPDICHASSGTRVLRCDFWPGHRVDAHPARARTRWHGPNVKRALEEVVSAQSLDDVKLVLALHQQAHVAPETETVVAGDTAKAHRKRAAHTMADVQAFDIQPSQNQTHMGSQIAGQFLTIRPVTRNSSAVGVTIGAATYDVYQYLTRLRPTRCWWTPARPTL